MKYTTSIIPNKNNSINLGSISKFFNNLYVSNITYGTNTGWVYSNNGTVGVNSPRNEVLTGLSTLTNSTILNTDSFLTAFGKLQAQIDNFSGGGANTTLSNLTSPTEINQDLLASGTRNLGNDSSGIWDNLYARNVVIYDSSATPLSLERVSTNSGKWNFNISSDPVGTGEIFPVGSLTIVGQSANRLFAIRAGNTGLPQFRVHPTRVEIVGSDTTDWGQLYINNTINDLSSSELLMHSNDIETYQGLTLKFGTSQYAWVNATGQSHSIPSFMQIANDMNYTNARVGIRVAGTQKAIFRYESIIFNPTSLTQTSVHPFLVNDTTANTGEALAINGIDSKDCIVSVNQEYTNLAGAIQIKSEGNYTWLTQHGSTHGIHPNRSFLSFNNPNGILGLRTNNTNRFTLTYAGNIGIGDDFYDPATIFHIKHTNPELLVEGTNNASITVKSAGNTTYSGVNISNTNGEYGDIYFYGSNYVTSQFRDRMILSKSTGSIGIHVGTTNKLNVNSTGVGIGLNFLDPTYIFHVQQDSSSNDVAMFENVGTNAYLNIKAPDGNGAYTIFTAGSSSADFGLTGSSHPTIPNVFAYTITDVMKFREYLGASFYRQDTLESTTYPRFSFGLNYETDAMFGIKRTVDDTADSFYIENSAGSGHFKIDQDALVTTYNNIIPNADNSYTLGTDSNRWFNIFSKRLDTNAGTLPTTVTAIALTATLSNPSSTNETAINYLITTGTGSNNSKQKGMTVELLDGGYTGDQSTNSISAINRSLGTGTEWTIGKCNTGFGGDSVGETSGSNVGVFGYSANSSIETIGVLGLGVGNIGSTTDRSIGVVGVSTASVNKIGGYFTIFSGSQPNFDFSAGLVADNGGTSNPIFMAKNNGLDRFVVYDGVNGSYAVSTTSVDVASIGATSTVDNKPIYMGVFGSAHATYAKQAWVNYVNADSDAVVQFRLNNNLKMMYGVNGVGIGSDMTSPQYALHLSQATTELARFENSTNNNEAWITVKTNDTAFGAYFNAESGSGAGGFGFIGSANSSTPNLTTLYNNVIDGSVSLRINQRNKLWVTEQSTTTYTRVGIGDNFNTPNAMLHIKRAVDDTADSFRIEDSSGNKQFYINNDFVYINKYLYVGTNSGHTSNGDSHFELQFSTLSGYNPFVIYEENSNPTLICGNDGSLSVFGTIFPNESTFSQPINLGGNVDRFTDAFIKHLNIEPTLSNPSIKLNSGLSTTPSNGGIEYDSSNGFYFTHNNSRQLLISSISSNLCFLGSFQIDINTSTDVCTIDDSVTFSSLVFGQLETGDGVAFIESTLPTGVTQNTKVYIRVLSSTTFTVHPTQSDAINNTNIINFGASNLTDQTIAVREIGSRFSDYTVREDSSGLTINMKQVSQLYDRDIFYVKLDRNSNLTLNIDSTDFAGVVRWVFLSNQDYQKSGSQTITFSTGSTTEKKIRVYYKSTLNCFIAEEIDSY